MKRKTKIISAAALIVLLLTFSIAAYAYFSITRDSEPDINIDPTVNTITVSDFSELFAATQAETYNDSSSVAGTGGKSRKTVVLAADITLPRDLEITADVHLSLAGHILYLGGHTLTVRHSYSGSIVISGGRFIVDAGADGGIYADTPRAAVFFDSIEIGTLDNGSFSSLTERLHILSADPTFIAYNFFRSVAGSLADMTNVLTARDSYTAVSAKTEFTSADFFRHYKDDCDTHGTVPCSYLFTDVDLPLSYLGYPGVTVRYSAGGTAVTKDGKLTGTAGDDSITVTVNAGADGTEYTCVFPLHVPDISTAAAQSSAMCTAITRHLSRYWGETEIDGKTVNTYIINRDCYLPISFPFTALTVVYTSYDETGATLFTSPESPGTETILFTPTTSTVRLTAAVKNSDTTVSEVSFDIVSSNTATVKSAVTIANDLTKKWYGTAIDVKTDGNGYTYSGNAATSGILGYLPLYSLSYYETYDGGTYAKTYPGVKSIRYSVVYGDAAHEYYSISDPLGDEMWQRFSVSSGKPENDAGAVYLNIAMRIEYNGKESDAIIQIPVRCTLTGDDSGLNAFLPYYSVFDKALTELTGGYTITSFDMPFNYRRALPIVCYGLAVDGADENTLTAALSAISLVFTDKDGTAHTLSGTVTTDRDTGLAFLSFTSSIDALLNSQDRLAAEAESGKAHYTISINSSALPVENTGLRLVYQFKRSFNTESSWATYSDTSDVTVPGVIHYGTQVTDANFYIWLYNTFNTSGATVSTADAAVLLTDWLSRNVTLDYKNSNDTYLKAVTDFTGIRYLTGTQTLRLSGAQISSANIREIAYMSSLVTLDLSGCSIVVTAAETSPFESWSADNSALKNLTHLNLSDNRIYSFTWLLPLCKNVSSSLVNITVSGNVPGTNASDNVFYGSDGLSNYGTYRELTLYGITVYSAGDIGSPILFTDSHAASQLYLNLINIEYQDKLPKGASLLDMLNQLSTTPSDYSINRTASTSKYSCSISGATIEFTTDDPLGNTFSMIFTATSNSTQYQIIINFTITRF